MMHYLPVFNRKDKEVSALPLLITCMMATKQLVPSVRRCWCCLRKLVCKRAKITAVRSCPSWLSGCEDNRWAQLNLKLSANKPADSYITKCQRTRPITGDLNGSMDQSQAVILPRLLKHPLVVSGWNVAGYIYKCNYLFRFAGCSPAPWVENKQTSS